MIRDEVAGLGYDAGKAVLQRSIWPTLTFGSGGIIPHLPANCGAPGKSRPVLPCRQKIVESAERLQWATRPIMVVHWGVRPRQFVDYFMGRPQPEWRGSLTNDLRRRHRHWYPFSPAVDCKTRGGSQIFPQIDLARTTKLGEDLTQTNN